MKKLIIIAGLCILVFYLLVLRRVEQVMEVMHQSTPDASKSSCTVSNINLDKLRGQGLSYGYFRVTGRLTNNCNQATGVQVKVTAYDKANNILRVDDIWPASTANIPAHSAYPFQWQMEAPGISKFTVNIIGLQTWAH